MTERAQKTLPRGAPPLDEVPITRTFAKPFRSEPLLVHRDGIYSMDVRYLRVLEVLAELGRQPGLEVRTMASGLAGPNAVASDFRALLTVAGVSMPAAIPVIDNAVLRRENGVTSTTFVSARHKAIAVALGHAMFGTRDAVGAAFQKKATTAIPKFLTSVLYKEAILNHLLRNHERLLELVAAGDADGLRREFDAVFASFLLHRLQADAVRYDEDTGKYHSKDRLIPTKEFAMSGGAKGSRVVADKSIYLNGNLLDNHFRCRRRAVFAFNGVLNYFMTLLLAQPRASYLRRYAFTFKHTTPAQIRGKLERFGTVLKFDTSNMDNNVPLFAVDTFCTDIIGELYSPAFAKLMRASFTAAYFQPPTSERDSEPGFWFGDPMSVGDQTMAGLPSGIAPNPDFGKWWMTTCAYCVLDDEFGDVLENLEGYLTGAHGDVGLLDSSDDMVLGVVRTAAMDDWISDLKKRPSISPYMKMTLEGSSFLGNVLYEDAAGKLQLAPDVTSFLKNWLVPEHGLNHPSRAHWAFGWQARSKHYSMAPRYADVKYYLDEAWARHLPGVPTIDQSVFAESGTPDLLAVLARSEVDELFLRKPEMLHYALSPSDITPELLAQFSLTIPPEKLEPLYRAHYHGALS